jgi:hypothetical protein
MVSDACAKHAIGWHGAHALRRQPAGLPRAVG